MPFSYILLVRKRMLYHHAAPLSHWKFARKFFLSALLAMDIQVGTCCLG